MGSTPLTLRCSKCRKYREWDSNKFNYDKLSDRNLIATGRARKARRGTSGRRGNPGGLAVEMKHDGVSPHTGKYCGHVFWSTHPHAVEKWRNIGMKKETEKAPATKPSTCFACAHSYMEPDSGLICGHESAGALGTNIRAHPLQKCGWKFFEQHPLRTPSGDRKK